MIDGKALLLDADLTNNVLSSFRTTDIDLIGHGMYINNELIVVPPQGYYELTDMDTSIIQFSQQRLKDEPLKCIIDYAALYRTYVSEDLNLLKRTVARYYKIGQIRGVSSEIDIIEAIKNKYENNSNNSMEVLSISYVSIEAEPYTKFLIKDSADTDAQEWIMNNDGIMTFYNQGTSIEELKFIQYNDNDIIEDRNEIIYDDAYALQDVIINYICLIKEIK